MHLYVAALELIGLDMARNETYPTQPVHNSGLILMNLGNSLIYGFIILGLSLVEVSNSQTNIGLERIMGPKKVWVPKKF